LSTIIYDREKNKIIFM